MSSRRNFTRVDSRVGIARPFYFHQLYRPRQPLGRGTTAEKRTGPFPLPVGDLLSSFFWTYACMQVLAGWLVDRFEVKWVFALGFFVRSTATAVTGMVHTFAMLLAIRVILGVGESIAYPSYSKIFASHFVERKRGVANSVIGMGQSLGPAFGIFFGGKCTAAHFGWRPFFIGLGLLGLLWLPPWLQWMPRTPNFGTLHMKQGPGLWEIVCHRSSWGTWIGHFCMNYPLYFLLTWLPYYLVSERHFSLKVCPASAARRL